MRIIRALVGDDRAQDLAEYAIAMAVIAAVVVMIANAIGTDVTTLWSTTQPKIKTVIDAE